MGRFTLKFLKGSKQTSAASNGMRRLGTSWKPEGLPGMSLKFSVRPSPTQRRRRNASNMKFVIHIQYKLAGRQPCY